MAGLKFNCDLIIRWTRWTCASDGRNYHNCYFRKIEKWWGRKLTNKTYNLWQIWRWCHNWALSCTCSITLLAWVFDWLRGKVSFIRITLLNCQRYFIGITNRTARSRYRFGYLSFSLTSIWIYGW